MKNNIQKDILRLLKNNGGKAMRFKEIAKKLKVSQQIYEQLDDILADLVNQRKIGQKSNQYFFKSLNPETYEGILEVKAQGFGFVRVSETLEFFVPLRLFDTALNGDKVQVEPLPQKGRGGFGQNNLQEAEVIAVLARKNLEIVGQLFKADGEYYVRSDDSALIYDFWAREIGKAKSGDKVVLKFEDFIHDVPHGIVVEVLGSAKDTNVGVTAIARAKGFKEDFPDDVLAETEAISEQIDAKEIARRLDLRQKPIFTIDPADAKDFDDAIHTEIRSDGNWEIGIHIADVSHFIKPASALETEAYQRATSVYLVDRVIPMLPEKLSNGVCSLRPHEDKLAYSVLLVCKPDTTIVSYEIRETVIHPHRRFSYEEAQELLFLEHKSHQEAQSNEQISHIQVQQAWTFAKKLRELRIKNGAVLVERDEAKIVLDEQGKLMGIKRKVMAEANWLIEEFMLLANRVVAEHIQKKPKPFVYRIHPQPDAIKVQNLSEYVKLFGRSLPHQNGKVHPTALNNLLAQARTSGEAHLIQEAVLRTMAKAIYSTENIGHFGLGFAHYSHFTSPIRRFPDLIIHRILKGMQAPENLVEQAKHCSDRERAAEEAERNSVKLKQIEYLQQCIGQSFDATISGLTNFGIFAEIDAFLAEGLIAMRELDDDRYEYDEKNFVIYGLRKNRRFKLGDKIRVVVENADVSTLKVDFRLAPNLPAKKSK